MNTDFGNWLQGRINDGMTYFQGNPNETYEIGRPIFARGNYLKLNFNGAKVVKTNTGSWNAVFYNCAKEFIVENMVFDYNRVEWHSYAKVFGLQVPEWLGNEYGLPVMYRDLPGRQKFLVRNCLFQDSENGTKFPGKRDNWIFVFNCDNPPEKIRILNNTSTCNNTELTGGQSGLNDVLIKGNTIYGGKTTSGIISCLSRYEGTEPRTVKRFRVINNTITNAWRIAFAFGGDSDVGANVDFEHLEFKGNRITFMEDADTFPMLVRGKVAGKLGTVIVKDNHVDLSNLHPDGDFKPRVTAIDSTTETGSLIESDNIFKQPQGGNFKIKKTGNIR